MVNNHFRTVLVYRKQPRKSSSLKTTSSTGKMAWSLPMPTCTTMPPGATASIAVCSMPQTCQLACLAADGPREPLISYHRLMVVNLCNCITIISGQNVVRFASWAIPLLHKVLSPSVHCASAKSILLCLGKLFKKTDNKGVTLSIYFSRLQLT